MSTWRIVRGALTSSRRESTPSLLRYAPRVGSLVWLFAAVMAAVLVLWVVSLARRAAIRRRGGSPASVRRELDRMTHDPEISDRLLERMRRKHPGAGEARLVQLAIAELRADRRR